MIQIQYYKPIAMMIKVTRVAFMMSVAVALNACGPPAPVPAPYFIPNPPYPPQTVDLSSREPQRPVDNIQQVSPSATASHIGEYPWARQTSKASEVISPYEPYHTIDISGFSHGQLARDPSNKRIFRVP